MARKSTIICRVRYEGWSANLVREGSCYILATTLISKSTLQPIVEPLSRLAAARYLVAVKEGRTPLVRRSLPGSR